MASLASNTGENRASTTTLYVTQSVTVVVVGMKDRHAFATVSNFYSFAILKIYPVLCFFLFIYISYLFSL